MLLPPVSAERPEIAANVGAIRANVHLIPGNIRSVPGDFCRRAKPQISAELPAILPQVDAVASDVPEVGANIRAQRSRTERHCPREPHAAAQAAVKAAGEWGATRETAVKASWESRTASEAAVKATWESGTASEAATEAAGKPHSAGSSTASKGRSVGRNRHHTQSGCRGKSDNRVTSHCVPPRLFLTLVMRFGRGLRQAGSRFGLCSQNKNTTILFRFAKNLDLAGVPQPARHKVAGLALSSRRRRRGRRGAIRADRCGRRGRI